MNNKANNKAKFVTFNCRSLVRSMDCIRTLCKSSHLIALQETCLLPHDIPLLGAVDRDFEYIGKSAVDVSAGVLRGRPFGGVAILWRKNVFSAVTAVPCASDRIVAVKVSVAECSFLVFSVYMPTDDQAHLVEFTHCLSEINAIIDSCEIDYSYILGDFNAHPGRRFGNELQSFCADQKWTCVDMELLGLESGSYTYVSDSHGTSSWLDHCVVTQAARHTVDKVLINHSVFWSDHFPLEIQCSLNVLIPKTTFCSNHNSNVLWGERDGSQMSQYTDFCNEKLKQIDFPSVLSRCADTVCNDPNHKIVLLNLYDRIIDVLKKAAVYSCKNKKFYCKKKYVCGWNKHIKAAHSEARLWFQYWVLYNKPRDGFVYDKMRVSRNVFKAKLKWCQTNERQIKMDILGVNHANKNFSSFWKHTKRLSPKPSAPVSVDGLSEPSQIAEMFKEHFRVQPTVGYNRVDNVYHNCNSYCTGKKGVLIGAKDIRSVLRKMSKGKSPGHDHLSIEHLQYAGVHLPRVLAMFFSLCLNHDYLPDSLLKTIVVPIVKNKTGSAGDKSNYRPISLATIVAKVLDRLLDQELGTCVKLHDAQFGFRPGLSTEAAVLCLKQTVQYYTARDTPVYAVFLDLSKAFDLVQYDILWKKLIEDTNLPQEYISILEYWYSHQQNYVRWSGELSSMYRLESGVRQGGISSPALFNLYMNKLIVELSGAGVGCSVDGTFVNNLSYADDMVLLCPSISALHKLISICERYAETHGLRYNSAKSELLVFKTKYKTYKVPPVRLNGTPLKQVPSFKYLGHWVDESLRDDVDMERERRALCVRANMLARRFARCTTQVKVTLFKAYCNSLYTCSLWMNYTQGAYKALRTQYNNAFRGLMGLPRYCSASGMLAEVEVDSFSAIIRKSIASLIYRVRGSPNSLLQTVAARLDVDSAIMRHWTSVHLAKDVRLSYNNNIFIRH